jgi:hypothetical protein
MGYAVLVPIVMMIAVPMVAAAEQDKINRNVETVITNQQRHQWDGWTRDPRGDYVPPPADQPRTPSYGAPPIPQR